MDKSHRQAQRALIITVSVTQFFTAFIGSAMNVAVEAVAAEFALQPQDATWIVTIFTVCSASFLLTASAIAQYFGLKRVYSAGCILAGLSALLLSMVPSFSLLIIGRALQGFILALIFCSGIALLMARIDKTQRALALAISTAGVYGGLSLSPTIAGLLIDTIGWRWIFVLASGGIFTGAYFACKLSKETPPHRQANLIDILLSMFAMAFILLGLSLLAKGPVMWLIGLVGVLLLGIFLYRQHKSAHALLPTSLLGHNRALTLALCASILNYGSNFAVTLLLALHLQFIVGYSAASTGLILMTQPVAMTVFSLLTGKLNQSLSAHALTVCGMGCICLAFVYYSLFLDMHTPLYAIMGAQVLTGVGFGLFSAPNTNIVMSAVPPAQYALASALQALSRNFGQACSMALATTLLYHFIDALVGTTLYLYELNYAISAIFSCNTVMALLGTLICLVAWRRVKTTP